MGDEIRDLKELGAEGSKPGSVASGESPNAESASPAAPEKSHEHHAPRFGKKRTDGGGKASGSYEVKGSLKERMANLYDRQYKKLLIIPAIVIIAAVVILFMSYSSTGSLFKRDISLSGGVSISAATDFRDDVALENELAAMFPGSDVSVRKLTQVGRSVGLVVEANFQSADETEKLLEFLGGKLGLGKKAFTVQSVGASLGISFFRQLRNGILIAFVFMALTVFVYFKMFSGKWLWLPGLFVVWTAFVDILCTLAVVSLAGLHVSAAGLAAFLMLIGYSVDTDILLTVRALKGTEHSLPERIRSAMKTGILMSLTAFGAVVAGYFFAESETIKQIMFILSVGMVFDILHTWLTNAGLLRWYLERKGTI